MEFLENGRRDRNSLLSKFLFKFPTLNYVLFFHERRNSPFLVSDVGYRAEFITLQDEFPSRFALAQ